MFNKCIGFVLCCSSILLHGVELPIQDPTVHTEILTQEKILKDSRLRHLFNLDPGWTKWLLTFDKIIGKPPFSFVVKRVVQTEPGTFIPDRKAMDPVEILKAKLFDGPMNTYLCTRGFLPGERVVCRIISSDQLFKEISFFPRPIIIKKKSGEILLQAELISVNPTYYQLTISTSNPEEEFEFRSTSVNETMAHKLKGPQTFGYSPEVIGVKGAVSKIEIKLEAGDSYYCDLPWGLDLMEYIKGNK